jgi:hypothetical protein
MVNFGEVIEYILSQRFKEDSKLFRLAGAHERMGLQLQISPHLRNNLAFDSQRGLEMLNVVFGLA